MFLSPSPYSLLLFVSLPACIFIFPSFFFSFSLCPARRVYFFVPVAVLLPVPACICCPELLP